MAGRVMIINMMPMTIHELYGHPDSHWLPRLLESPDQLISKFKGVMSEFSLWKTLWRGGVPWIYYATRFIPHPFFSILCTNLY